MPERLRNRTAAAAVAGALAAAVMVAAIAAVLVDDGDGDGGSGVDTGAALAAAPNGDGAGFVEFRDDGAGFSLGYPAGWKRLPAADPQVRLAVAGGMEASFLVRALPMPFDGGNNSMEVVRAVADEVVGSAAGVEMMARPRQVELDGRPAWLYLYRFRDDASGSFGVHAHYFAPHGDRLVTIVLQALPESSYEGLAPVFDRIIASFTLRRQ